MYIAPGLIYLHIPRTGGTFVSHLLDRHKLGSMHFSGEVTGHEGISSLPEGHAAQSLVFASVRDPWSWYCSINAHYRHKSNLDGFLHEIFVRSVPFKEVMRAFTRPSEVSLERQSKAVRYPGARIPEERFLGKLAESGLGLWSWMILRTLCMDRVELVPGVIRHLELDGADVPWSIDAVIDTAQLRDGLCQIIGAWRPDLLATMENDIQTGEAMNKKAGHRGVQPNGRPDPAYFCTESQNWVNEADGWMMRRLGFDKPVGIRPAVQLLR